MIVQDEKRKVNERWEEGRLKRCLIRVLYALVVFLVTLFVSGSLLNRETVSMTRQPGYSTLPVISFNVFGHEINPTSGYTTELDMSTVRSVILPLGKDRTVRFTADSELAGFSDLRFEVRSADGSSLVENTPIEQLTQSAAGDRVSARFVIKDLISYDTEYMLVILGEKDAATVRYYTRIVCSSSDAAYHVQEKLDFVTAFHENSLDREKSSAIATYIESNAEGDNSSYARVDIHSSFQQITFGDLQVTAHTSPEIRISDLQQQTGEFLLDYTLSVRDEERRVREYRVTESYQLRYAPERIYLLEYDRTMNYLFRGDKEDVVSGTLQMSITDPAMEMIESDGGNTLVFRTGNRLYAYNLTENKLSLLYAFDDDVRRQTAMSSEMKTLQIDEAGNVFFLVSGYIGRGRYEGASGVLIYYFDAAVNTVEEVVFLPTQAAPQVLNAGIRRLAFVNQDEELYLMPDENVYCVDLKKRTAQVIIEDMARDTYEISASESKMIWQSAEENAQNEMYLIDFNSGEEQTIPAEGSDKIIPLGFMGEDLVYGLLRPTDVRLDAVGNPVEPMYSIRIRDVAGNILENYEKDGIYITDARTNDNQMQLTRVRYDASIGGYLPETADQIMDTLPAEESANRLRIRTDPVQKNLVELVLKNNVDGGDLKLLTPGEVLREEGVALTLHKSAQPFTRYYVYDKGEIVGLYASVADAIRYAYDRFGYVTDHDGRVIWGRGNLVARNQIMAITAMVESGQIRADDKSRSLPACLDLMLTHAGISRNVNLLLSEGNNAYEILSSSLQDVTVLDLPGCRMNATLYYANRDLPVLAGLNDGSNVLLIGFNERNVVIADPVAGTVSKMGMNDAAAYFEQNGNRFLTYFPVSER